ncbi:ParB/Srx family N-terminal domain-containing protein [bacterium]|nr:ParB/Srx family N-terminal domain-containing protein [bacterium]
MNVKNQLISTLKPYARNGKVHTDLQIKQVAESIKRFGWVQPIVVDKDNNVVIGHCRLESAKWLGLKEVPTVIVEHLTEEEIKALRIADNKLNESDWDVLLVNEEVELLPLDLQVISGWEVNLLKVELENKEKEIDEIHTENECPSCGYKW